MVIQIDQHGTQSSPHVLADDRRCCLDRVETLPVVTPRRIRANRPVSDRINELGQVPIGQELRGGGGDAGYPRGQFRIRRRMNEDLKRIDAQAP